VNACYAHERAVAAEALAESLAGPAQLAQFAAGCEVLATAVRAWRTVPPVTRDEIDTVANQLHGLSRAISEIQQRRMK